MSEIDVLLPLPGQPANTNGDNEMEQNNMVIALTAMGNEFGAAAARRVNRFDQLGADAGAMWAVAMTTPTVLAAQGIRMMAESGSGRTRAETNNPSATGVGTG